MAKTVEQKKAWDEMLAITDINPNWMHDKQLSKKVTELQVKAAGEQYQPTKQWRVLSDEEKHLLRTEYEKGTQEYLIREMLCVNWYLLKDAIKEMDLKRPIDLEKLQLEREIIDLYQYGFTPPEIINLGWEVKTGRIYSILRKNNVKRRPKGYKYKRNPIMYICYLNGAERARGSIKEIAQALGMAEMSVRTNHKLSDKPLQKGGSLVRMVNK